MVRVRTKDYGRQYRALWSELGPALQRAFLEEDPILGEAVERFERRFAEYHGVAQAVGVGSGTDAITWTLRELGLGAGDEVITCAHTFSGVLSALLHAGVDPRLVDADPATGLLDARHVEPA